MSQPPFKSCPKTIFFSTRVHEDDVAKDAFLGMPNDSKAWNEVTTEQLENDLNSFFKLFLSPNQLKSHEFQTNMIRRIQEKYGPDEYRAPPYEPLHDLEKLAKDVDNLITGTTGIIIVDDPLCGVDTSGFDWRGRFDTMVQDKMSVERRFLIECPEEVVSASELHSLREDRPHQGNPKKNYHIINDKHNRRKRR